MTRVKNVYIIVGLIALLSGCAVIATLSNAQGIPPADQSTQVANSAGGELSAPLNASALKPRISVQ